MTSINNFTLDDIDKHEDFIDLLEIPKIQKQQGGTNANNSDEDEQSVNINANNSDEDEQSVNINANNSDEDEPSVNIDNDSKKEKKKSTNEPETSINIDAKGNNSDEDEQSVNINANGNNSYEAEQSVNIDANNDEAEQSVNIDANNDETEQSVNIDANNSAEAEDEQSINIDINDNDEEKSNNSNSNNSNDDFEFTIDGDIIDNTTKEKVVILDEEIIPEERVISNDIDQRDDFLNEYIKLIPEKNRNRFNVLKKVNNVVNFFEYLKYNHSNLENGVIKSYKLKTNKYYSNLDNYLNGKFDNNYLVPIVNEKKTLYNIKETEDTIIQGIGLDDVDDPMIIKKDNEEDILKQIGMRKKYKETSFRQNYSYNNELNELYLSQQQYYNSIDNDTIEFNTNNDINVYNYEIMTLNNNKYELNDYSHKILGAFNFNLFEDKQVVKGSEISIKGFMKVPIHKNNILELNKHHLLDVTNNTYGYLDLIKNCKLSNIEIVNDSVQINDLVKVIDLKKQNENDINVGYIIELTDESISIKPLSTSSEHTDITKNIVIEINDNIMILNITKGERYLSTQEESLYKQYMFDEHEDKITKLKYKSLLENIIPPTNEIVENIKTTFNDTSIENLQQTLDYYGLKIDDITNELFTPIREILYKNINDKITQSIKNDAKFKSFLKKPSNNVLKNFQFISNRMLKQYENVYGEYPYYKMDIDSELKRLEWLKSRPDYGEFFFKNIIKTINDKIDINIDDIITNIQSSLTKLLQDKIILEQDIEKEKNRILSSKNKCVDNYISKEYQSINDMKRDNNREIYVDKDKQRVGDSNLVPLNSYAIVYLDNGKKQIYKRIELDTGGNMWTLEGGINIEHIVISNKDFCDQQFKNINELNEAVKELDVCKFSNLENSCVTKELQQKLHDLNELTKVIIDKEYYLKQSDDLLNFNSNLTNELEYYNYYLNLIKDQQKRIFETTQQEIVADEKDEIDPTYETLYLKIDLYLEKIAELNDRQKYELLDELIKKYGREPNTRSGENHKNIYCKYGNKVLCCKHYTNMIEMFENPSNYNILLEETINIYGIEDSGKYWCNNCGKEIFMAEYETMEGFQKNGARDITHEIIDDDDEDAQDNTELIEMLKQNLNEADSSSNSNIIEIYTILKTLLTIMGIKLNSIDELKVIKDSKALVKTYIKNKEIWKQSYRGKPKSIDKNYNTYVNINTIIYTVSNLFIMLQVAIPHYSIIIPHSKCKTSLEGFPLDKNDKNINGIKYFSCILEQLRNTESIWKCLKKMKLTDVLLDIIKKLCNDDLIVHKYNLKRTYINDTIKTQEIDVYNNWIKFKPPLNLFKINNDSLNSITLTKKPNNLEELTHYYSLKYISELDNIVNKQPVENNIFLPALVQQSCCLTPLNNEYKILESIYKHNRPFEKIVNNVTILESFTNIIESKSFTINTLDIYDIPSFSSILLPLEDDLDQEIITELFEHYISEGDFIGQKHIYDDNICILTGSNRDVIKQKIYRNDDYYSLLQSIFKIKLVENKILNDNLNIITSFNNVIKENPLLNKNIYLNNFIEYLTNNNTKQTITKGWQDFNAQLEVEKDELIDLYDESKKSSLKEILSNIGTLTNIYEENKELYDEVKATRMFYESKLNLLYKYIYSYLGVNISKIKNNKTDEFIKVPPNWRINKSYVTNLTSNVLSDNDLVEKYIKIKQKNNSDANYYKLLSIINKTTKNIKYIFSEDHTFNCSNIEKFSKITIENLCSIIEFIFILLIKELLTYKSSPMVPLKTQTFESMDINPVLDDSYETKSKSKKKSSVNNTNVSTGAGANQDDQIDDISDGLTIMDESIETFTNETYELIYDILVKTNIHTVKSDSYTQYNIKENIEKKSDIEKESNLKFIEDLDKESRQALKTMISLGIDSWKDLSKKTNKNLYFDEPEEPSLDDNLEPTEDERNEQLAQDAISRFGENYTREQYDEMVDDNNRSQLEDNMIRQEQQSELMVDDDGDDYGADDYDGEF